MEIDASKPTDSIIITMSLVELDELGTVFLAALSTDTLHRHTVEFIESFTMRVREVMES